MVIHRDLKPENIGVDSNGRLKLFDFGLGRCVKKRSKDTESYKMTGETGTLRYMAPEVVLSKPYTEKVDTYSFGIVVWTMATNTVAFAALTAGHTHILTHTYTHHIYTHKHKHTHIHYTHTHSHSSLSHTHLISLPLSSHTPLFTVAYSHTPSHPSKCYQCPSATRRIRGLEKVPRPRGGGGGETPP